MTARRTFLLAIVSPALPVFASSCARNRGADSAPAAVKIPAVTGAVRLIFEKALGEGAVKSPGGLSIGPDGTFYLCDRDGRAVVRLGTAGEAIARFAGFDARDTRLFSPVDVTAERGVDIFVLDGASGRVIRLDRDLRGPSVIHDGGGRTGGFAPYAGIALDHESGDILLTDRNEGMVTRLDFTGRTTREAGGFGSVKRSLRDPAGIDSAPDGALFVADRGLGAVAFAARFGADIRLLGSGMLDAPADVAALPENRVAVADARGVLIFDRSGTALALAGYGTGRDMAPRSAAFREGCLYIPDARSNAILAYRVE